VSRGERKAASVAAAAEEPAPQSGVEGAPSDADLLRRVASGDVEALGALYDRHARALLAFARRAASPEDAEDIVQNVFLRALSCAERFDPAAASARPWLFGITARIAGERRRSLRRFGAAIVRLATFGKRAAEPHAVERTDVERALASLSPPKREALLLVEVEGLTCEEAAAALGVPVGTVWTRLHHARREMRDLLGETP
jgi:RNA polymerase sigma-70 factor (ECF subfamily)